MLLREPLVLRHALQERPVQLQGGHEVVFGQAFAVQRLQDLHELIPGGCSLPLPPRVLLRHHTPPGYVNFGTQYSSLSSIRNQAEPENPKIRLISDYFLDFGTLAR